MNVPEDSPVGVPPRHSLETLPFDNSFARLPPVFYTRLAPQPLPEPCLVSASAAAAALIGLDPSQFERPEFAQAFAGNLMLPGSDWLAAVYSGHQFGDWAGQLGDGRAHLLGEVRGADGAWELQLKGSGRTPYSRFGDGRAVLRSSIREYLCSEAMAGLGVPTTRALCVVGSPAPVQRETVETAAVVTRMAPSFVRFGSFEHWASRQRDAELQLLADYVINQFRPELRHAERPYEVLLGDVASRTAMLVADWQAVGFMHGVMNTDNMSILGLTLDYGPFGFMEAFDANAICNHSDHYGRYSYIEQPRVALWNLYALGAALETLIGGQGVARAIIDETYMSACTSAFLERMRAKLGFAASEDGDGDFINDTFALLQRNHADYTLFFRALSALPAAVEPQHRGRTDAPLRDLFADRVDCDAWLQRWRARLIAEGSVDGARQSAMRAVNPRYILRNWVAESAIRAARAGDFSETNAVLRCLQRPFDEQPEFERFAAPPPDWAEGLSVSCSS